MKGETRQTKPSQSGIVRTARASFAAFVAGLAAISNSPVAADDVPGVSYYPPVLASRTGSPRRALILAPGSEASPLVAADRTAYRDLLRLLGFVVVVVSTTERPDADAGLREFIRAVPPGADVALLLLGSVVPGPTGLYILPAGSTDGAAKPEMIMTEGLSVTDAIRRLASRGARDAVLIADGCYGSLPDCAAGLAGLPAGVSALVAARVPLSNSGSTGAHFATFGRAILPEMTKAGESFAQLVGALRSKISGSDRGIAATATLTDTFAFLPSGFLEGLPLSCNGVDPALSAKELRERASVEPLVADCAAAADRYAFSPYFKGKLAVVAEQEAAQTALAGCDPSPAQTYLEAYPTGRYRDAITARRASCPAPRPTAAANPLQPRAASAVANYFQRHDYQHGDGFGGLLGLYPAELRDRHGIVSRADHLRRLGAWYGDYDSVQFRPSLDTLDLSGCDRADRCLVRGTVRMQSLKVGDSRYSWRDEAFTLRLDLTSSQVLSECGVLDPSNAAGTQCE